MMSVSCRGYIMRKRRDSLASIVAKDLSERIESGEYEVGDKIPVEAQLCEIYNVSRTVVREAVAHLRSEGLLISRQGIGVFVVGRSNPSLKISEEYAGELSEVLEILELRVGVEIEAAGLAAHRKTKATLAAIRTIFDRTTDLDAFAQRPRELDFEFHMAIARATGNSYMPRFMAFIGPAIIPRSHLLHASAPEITREYLGKMIDEHRRILDAIESGDVVQAREAMRVHLAGSLDRYRKIKP